MRAIRVLLPGILAACVLLGGVALAEDAANIRVRVVTGDKEGNQVVIPPELRDVANILSQLPYRRFALVNEKTERMARGSEMRMQLNDTEQLAVGIETMSDWQVRVTIAFLKYHDDWGEYRVSQKVLKVLEPRASTAVVNDRVLINALPTIIVVTATP